MGLLSEKLDQLIEDMKMDLAKNELENPATVYLTILNHLLAERPRIHGYLLRRKANGEVHSERLESRVISDSGRAQVWPSVFEKSPTLDLKVHIEV